MGHVGLRRSSFALASPLASRLAPSSFGGDGVTFSKPPVFDAEDLRHTHVHYLIESLLDIIEYLLVDIDLSQKRPF